MYRPSYWQQVRGALHRHWKEVQEISQGAKGSLATAPQYTGQLYCSMLVPEPITNSGQADGGWMDRVGISRAGLGRIFTGASVPTT